MKKTQIVNRRIDDSETVYIGRSNKSQFHYGNPFIIGIHGDRKKVIEKFDLWLRGYAYGVVEPERREWILKNLDKLDGQVLGCWCVPQPCHGEVYLQLLKERSEGMLCIK